MTALPFPEKISINSQPKIADASQILEMGDNYVQGIEIGLNPQHEVWDIVYTPLDKADFLTLKATLDTARTVQKLTWAAPPEDVERNYLVVKDSRRYRPLGADLWEYALQLREVL